MTDLMGAIHALLNYCAPALVALKAIAESNFTTSAIGSLGGAVGGAFAAQRVIERNKAKEELTKEIRNTNAAIALTFDISSSILSLKKQQLAEMKSTFNSAREVVRNLEEDARLGRPPPKDAFEFRADLTTIPTSKLPTDALRTKIYEQLSIIGLSLSLVTQIHTSVAMFDDLVAHRNKLIDAFKARPDQGSRAIVLSYFGLPLDGGHQNTEYPDTLNGIFTYADDAVFYCSRLCEELQKHGDDLALKYSQLFGGKPPRIHRVSYEKAASLGLMPPSADYDDWLSSFQKLP